VRLGLVRFGESWWGMVRFGLPPNTDFFMVWFGKVRPGWVRFGLVRRGLARYGRVWYGTVRCGRVPVKATKKKPEN